MPSMNLTNQFLIAMPSLSDERFQRSVVYICEHNDQGAMGLVINKLYDDVTITDFIEKLAIPISTQFSLAHLHRPVMYGGPVSEEQGFILHSPEHRYTASIELSDDLVITTSRDIMLSLGSNKHPEHFFVALGYCAWYPLQLEAEIAHNDWLVVEADNEIIFHTPIEKRWETAAKRLGVDILSLSEQIGHA